jgi:hypothetical protein
MSIETVHSLTSRSRQKSLVCSIFLILIAVFAISMVAAIAGTEPDQELLGPDKWPITVEQAVSDIIPRLSQFEKLKIRLTKKENTISLYFDLGTSIRNRYGLWRGNDKLMLSACGTRCHPDDASMKIIEALWQELQKIAWQRALIPLEAHFLCRLARANR